ncbi:RIIa domain-containing protein 1-like [Pristis pectinata]|uniref:RIIa domain-containing protein 1-like n=1 Tax=Pristis pectinata TaxID=685728 RepID=UPI00223E6C55|nr:RIIa domain-containing protein 1-like [Pristis pectinata]
MAEFNLNVPSPYGMEGYDVGALSVEQQEKLWDFKINTRIANEYYLREHPEVEILLGEFMRSVLLKKPKNIGEFAAEYYTDARLPEKIQRKVYEREKMLKQK